MVGPSDNRLVLRGPNVFVIGAPKCGTTALAQYLSETPGVCVSTPKEPHFFCRDIHAFRKEENRYEDYEDYVSRSFAGQQPSDDVLVDASVWNLYSDCAVPGILESCPDARFVVMLRNPVDLVISLYAHRSDLGVETRPDVITAFWDSIGARGFTDGSSKVNNVDYSASCSLGWQVERLLSRVPADRVFFGLLEDLRERPLWLWRKLCDHIGARAGDRAEFPPANVRHGVPRRVLGLPINAHGIRLLTRPPRAVMKFRKAALALLPIRKFGLQERFVSRMRSNPGQAAIPDDALRGLKDHFADDIARLQRCTGMDLQRWLGAEA